MDHLKSYKIYEKLGINEDLEDLVELCKKELDGKNNCVVRTNYKGKNISIILKIEKMKRRSGYFIVINQEENIFKIVIEDIDSDSLSHEIKHLDRAISRNYKIDKYEDYRSINKLQLVALKNLTRDNISNEMLSKLMYYFNPDEFEAQYLTMYYDLKKIIKDNMTREEKKSIINKYLTDNEFTFSYLIYYYSPFKIEKFFKNRKSLNFYIETLFKNIEKYKRENREGSSMISNIFYLVYKNFTMNFTNKFTKDEKEISKFVKIFNNDINRLVEKGYKKIFRIFSLFI